jgi:hypothetical protein
MGPTRRSLIGVVVIGAVIVLSGMAMGRVWWCAGGDLYPWAWDIWSRHCSQHLIDPYTISHMQHGIGLYLLLVAFAGRRLPRTGIVWSVALVEAAWEIVENTNWMIQRYRTTTISLDYFGDSILNSLGDYVACMVGVLIAERLPWRLALTLFFVLELVSLCWIRDSLLLNILMLISPIDAVRQWQAG